MGRKLEVIALIHSQTLPNSPRAKRVKQELGGTLVITTFARLKDWARSFRQHSPSLSFLCYTSKTTVTVRELRAVDVVLITYGLLNYEKANGSKLVKLLWRRLVLDEGQAITAPRSTQLGACNALQARNRWVLARPQRLEEVQAYLQFLRVEPWAEAEWWTSESNQHIYTRIYNTGTRQVKTAS